MKIKFILKSSLFLFGFLILFYKITELRLRNHRGFCKVIQDNESEFNLPSLDRKKNYDWLILGSSEARVFALGDHPKVLQEVLGPQKKILNWSKAMGGGPKLQKIYLEYFLKRSHFSGKIIYFLNGLEFLFDPSDMESHFKNFEPWDLDFFKILYENGFPTSLLMRYLSDNVMFNRCKEIEDHSEKYLAENRMRYSMGLAQPFSEVDRHHVRQVWKKKLAAQSQWLSRNLDLFEELLLLARSHDLEVIAILSPHFAQEGAAQDVIETKLGQWAERGLLHWRNEVSFSNLPEDFSDHGHLSSVGVKKFAESVLSKL